jgi:hypothetical protein
MLSGDPSMSFPSNPSLQRLAQRTMLNGVMGNLPSPCGANCSYTLQFQGPYLQCSSQTRNRTLLYNADNEAETNTTVYSSVWTNTALLWLPSAEQNAPETSARLNFTTLRANTLAYKSTTFKLNVTQNELSCVPSRAEYEVQSVYKNSVQHIQISTNAVHPLMNLENGVFWPTDPSNSRKSRSKRQFSLNPAQVWTGPYTITQKNISQVDYIRDANLMAVIQAMAVPLTGWFQADFEPPNVDVTPIQTDPDGYKWSNAAWTVAQTGDHEGKLHPSHSTAQSAGTTFVIFYLAFRFSLLTF